MTKSSSAARRRNFEDAARRLKAHGFSLLLHEASLCITATAPDGRRYQLWPSVGRWKSMDSPKAKHQRGDLSAFLEHSARAAAAIEHDRRQWAGLRPATTIFTDAALCPRTGAAGWGAWLKGGERSSVSFGGPIAELLKSSSEAEARAAANAFAVARKRGLIEAGSVVMWQSDSLVALRWLLVAYPHSRDRPAKDGLSVGKPRKVPAGASTSAGARELARICAELELKVLTRHVRGHQQGPNRQWVNRLCDEIAGDHMRARRRIAEAEAAGHCPVLAREGTRP